MGVGVGVGEGVGGSGAWIATVTVRHRLLVVSANGKVAAPLVPGAIRNMSAAPACAPVPPRLVSEKRCSWPDGDAMIRSPSSTAKMRRTRVPDRVVVTPGATGSFPVPAATPIGPMGVVASTPPYRRMAATASLAPFDQSRS